MTSSISDELSALLAQRIEPDLSDVQNPEKWDVVCVCGHLRSAHSSLIGGTYREGGGTDRRTGESLGEGRDIPWSKSTSRATTTTTLRRCKGQTRTRATKAETTTVEVDPENPERKIITTELLTTCECPKFVGVLEVYAPRARWRQKHPRRDARGVRDPSPANHAFARGMRATQTSVANLAAVTTIEDETARAEMLNKLLAERVKWIDRECAAKGCTETANVWPAYTWTPADGAPPDDRSELRCARHRP